MGTALAAHCKAPPNEQPESLSQSRSASFGQSKSCDQRRSKRRDRSGPARSYADVGFSALLGGSGEPGDVRYCREPQGPEGRGRLHGKLGLDDKRGLSSDARRARLGGSVR